MPILPQTRVVSQDPGNYKDAPTEGIRRILEIVTGESYPREQKLPIEKIGKPSCLCNAVKLMMFEDYIRLSTTVATNALLERKGHKHALVITKGFKASMYISP